MQPGKRITYIHQHFRTPAQGGGMRGWEFVRRLARDGHQVTVICGGASAEKLCEQGVRIVRLRSPYENKMDDGRRIRAFASFAIRATLESLRHPTDVVFATSTPLTVAIPALVTASIRRVPFVFEVRDLWPSVPARLGYIRSKSALRVAQTLERIAYSRADRIVALSPGMAEGVLQTCPKANVTVIPNGSDRDLYSASNPLTGRTSKTQTGDGTPTVVYAGSLGDIYNIPWLVRLASALPNVHFQIIGEGRSQQESELLARQLGLDVTHLFQGRLSRHHIIHRLSTATLCVSSVREHPALHAASINKVFDAMAAGKPIIFNHGGWLSDLVVNAGAGWRLPEDVEEAAEQVRTILDDAELLARAGSISARLSSRFDREALYRLFQETLLKAG